MSNSSSILLSLLFIFQISSFAIDDQDGPETQDEAVAVDDASADESVSGSVNTGCTGSDYNLGRIIGSGPLQNLLTAYWPEDAFMLIDMFHTQGGVDNKFNIGWSAIGTVFGNENYGPYWLLAFPELSFNSAIGKSNRLRLKFNPANIAFMASSGGTSSGFENPFYMQNSYQWDFLSKDGEIQISPDQYDNAFYFRPLVNPGQVRINTTLNHAIRIESHQPSLFEVRFNSSAGLIDNMQLDIGTRYKKAERSVLYLYEDYSNYYDVDTLNLGLGLQYRTGDLGLSGEYSFQRNWFRQTQLNRQIIAVNAAYLLGDRIASVKEVEGNWDGYFKPLMGEHQLYIFAGPEWSIYNGSGVDWTVFKINNDVKFGVLKSLTLGESFQFVKTKNIDPKFRMELNTTFMNIPHRTYGPSEASKFEYCFGHWPKMGQVRIDLAYSLPIDNSDAYYNERNIFSRISPENVMYDEYSQNYVDMFIPSTVRSLNDSTGTIHDHDFLFRISAGLYYNVFISNAFEFRVDNVRYATYGYTSYNNYNNSYSNSNVSSGWKNFLYSDNLTFAFGNPKTNLFLIAFTCFGQSDKRLNGKDKFDFMLSATYEQAF
jgi:hypothetical protein